MGNVTDAVQQYQQALRLQPDYALAHNNLGHALLAPGEDGRGAAPFPEAARLDPQNAGAHYNIGLIARARGDMSQTIERFREAVRLQPDWVEAVEPGLDTRDDVFGRLAGS